MAKFWISFGALIAATAVGVGAFHAHGLEDHLNSKGIEATKVAEKLEICGTAVQYQLYHAITLLVIGLLTLHCRGKLVIVSGFLFCLGMVGFCGGIYVTVFDLAPIHFIIPIGGLLLIVAWMLLAVGVLFARREPLK